MVKIEKIDNTKHLRWCGVSGILEYTIPTNALLPRNSTHDYLSTEMSASVNQ